MKMKKAIVIGCSGSGKSTFSRRLRDATGLPLYYLDMIWHLPDRTNVTREKFDARIADILARDEWIIDGNYNRTLEVRLQACDTVFLFDLPTEVCIDGVRHRIGAVREDMPWGEEEFDPEFYEWIENFRRDRLPRIYELLGMYGAGKDVVIFHTREEADTWIGAARGKGENKWT